MLALFVLEAAARQMCSPQQTAAVYRGLYAGWLIDSRKTIPQHSKGHSRNLEGPGVTCHIANTSIFLGEHEHTRVSYVRVCMGSCALNICLRVQNGPMSYGAYNLGRNISSERYPVLARQ